VRFADLLEGRSQHEACRVMRENAVELFAATV
jgi:hypothetical protein